MDTTSLFPLVQVSFGMVALYFTQATPYFYP